MHIKINNHCIVRAGSVFHGPDQTAGVIPPKNLSVLQRTYQLPFMILDVCKRRTLDSLGFERTPNKEPDDDSHHTVALLTAKKIWNVW